MKNQTIEISTTISGTVDADGFPVDEGTTLRKTIFADVKSVGYGEYYEGLKDGIKATMIFKVNMPDFILTQETPRSITEYMPTQIKYKGTKYRIVRQYKRGYGFLELT
jgi:hypothetical protein